jgi:hypothetical protein
MVDNKIEFWENEKVNAINELNIAIETNNTFEVMRLKIQLDIIESTLIKFKNQ